jgi:hypothetical protein
MKNSKRPKQPTIFAFLQAMLLNVILAATFSFVINLSYVGPDKIGSMIHDTQIAFFIIFGIQFTLFAINAYLGKYVVQKGALRDDSLVVNDTAYAGTFAPYFILPALFGMDSMEKGILYFKDGIKKKHTIGKMDFSTPLQARVPTPTQSNGDITIDANTLNPYDIMVYQEFNPRDLEVHWTAEDLSASLLTRQLPPSVENYITLLITQRAFEQYENLIWMGSTAYTAATGSSGNGQLKFFDGLLKKMIADSSVYQTGSPVTLTSSNIKAKMQDLYQAAATNNKGLLTRSTKYQRMKYLVSVNTDLIYEEALASDQFKHQNYTEKGIRMFKGFEIVVVAGMPDDTIIFTEAISSTEGNLWLGMNSILDENFQIARILPHSELFALKMLMKMDVNYGYASKIFLYTTKTSGTFTA